jgi:transposase
MTGRQPKLSAAQKKQVVRLHTEGDHSPAEIGAMFGVSRQTVYRVVADAEGE